MRITSTKKQQRRRAPACRWASDLGRCVAGMSQERLLRRLLQTFAQDGVGEIVDEECVRHLRFLSGLAFGAPCVCVERSC